MTAFRKIRASLVLGSLVLLTACSGVGSPFCKASHDDPKIAALMHDTCRGDQGAAMQLGLWFEGHEEYSKAAHYYAVASATTGGPIHIYVPAAGKVAGYTMPVDTGPRVPGNPEAMYRLGLLYQKGLGVKQSTKKARDYFKQAAELGHPDAAAMLGAMN